MSVLRPLIEAVKLETHSHVIVGLEEYGIHWRAETKEACDVMAKIMGDHYTVMTREKFLTGLEEIEGKE